jgi:Zn-dependent peptidase ImmA (M78 family)
MVAFNDKILEVRANKFRRQCGISDDSAVDFEKLLISLDVLTVFKPLNGEFSGMALRTRSSNFMMINTKNPVGRQHFTIGHELYHLFIQEGFSFKMCKAGKFDKKDREEYNADIFSSYFLMPEVGIIKQIPEEELAWGGEISLATIIKLEQYFGVSRSALLIRLDKIGLLRTDYSNYKKDVKKSAIEHGYSDRLYSKTDEFKVVGNYGIKAKELFDKDKISESHYLSLMFDINIDIDNLNNKEDDKEI